MKKLLLGALLLSTSQFANAWTQVAICGTGDAIGGVDVFNDGEGYIVQILSVQDDERPEEFRTHVGELAAEINVNADLNKLAKGEQLSIVAGKASSIIFGGATTEAALLNLKVHDGLNYENNSTLAANGTVYSLFCYKSQN